VEGRLRKLCFLRGGCACLLPMTSKLGGWVENTSLLAVRLGGDCSMLRHVTSLAIRSYDRTRALFPSALVRLCARAQRELWGLRLTRGYGIGVA